MVIKVKDMKWTVRVLEPTDYISRHEECVAITLKMEREIHFRTDSLTIGAIRHELFHAYCNELHLASAELTVGQFEEIIAEFLEDYLPRLNRQANRIFKALKK